jgi:hypothetical protein
MIRDVCARSWKRIFSIPDPGAKKAPDAGFGSATMIRISTSVANPGLSRIPDPNFSIPDPDPQNKEFKYFFA